MRLLISAGIRRVRWSANARNGLFFVLTALNLQMPALTDTDPMLHGLENLFDLPTREQLEVAVALDPSRTVQLSRDSTIDGVTYAAGTQLDFSPEGEIRHSRKREARWPNGYAPPPEDDSVIFVRPEPPLRERLYAKSAEYCQAVGEWRETGYFSNGIFRRSRT